MEVIGCLPLKLKSINKSAAFLKHNMKSLDQNGVYYLHRWCMTSFIWSHSAKEGPEN